MLVNIPNKIQENRLRDAASAQAPKNPYGTNNMIFSITKALLRLLIPKVENNSRSTPTLLPLSLDKNVMNNRITIYIKNNVPAGTESMLFPFCSLLLFASKRHTKATIPAPTP